MIRALNSTLSSSTRIFGQTSRKILRIFEKTEDKEITHAKWKKKKGKYAGMRRSGGQTAVFLVRSSHAAAIFLKGPKLSRPPSTLKIITHGFI
jgi:hypothetical protein